MELTELVELVKSVEVRHGAYPVGWTKIVQDTKEAVVARLLDKYK